MTFTHLKSIANIVIVGAVMLSTLNADSCSDKQIQTLLKSSKVKELKKLYKSCKSKKTRIAYLIKRGDENRDNSLLKSAKADYREALDIIEENNFKMFEEYRDYLKTELGIKKPTPQKEETTTQRGVISSEELENYITPKSNGTRGAGMGEFSRVKGIPINFNSGSATIKDGVNLSQAREIGKLLSKPKYANQIIYITGYTDTKGSAIYNKELSQKRADGLKRYLVDKFQLKEDNLITEGLGESFPIHNKKGKEDYYRSRRVTLEYGN